MKRGDIYLVDLNPVKGSEQSGQRPAILFQNNFIIENTHTPINIPLTSNLKKAQFKGCLLIKDSGLIAESVALCYQMRVIDKSRLIKKIGKVHEDQMTQIEESVLYTLGIFI